MEYSKENLKKYAGISGIYLITRKSTGQMYVGQAKDLEYRLISKHLNFRDLKGGNKSLIEHSMQKYGINDFEVEILEVCEPEDLNYYEILWIKKLKTNRRRYRKLNHFNLTDGGDNAFGYGEFNISKDPQIQQKISNALKGKFKGENNPFYGKKHTKESLSKMSKNNARYWDGKHLSEEHKEKISKSNRGKKRTSKHNLNYSKSRTSSGFFHVSCTKTDEVYQGVIFRYNYYENDVKKTINSVDITNLEKRVREKGLEWKITDDEKAKAAIEFCKTQRNILPPSKYKFWHQSKVQYKKEYMFSHNEKGLNPRKCFFVKFKGKLIKCGMFNEFVTPTLIYDLINEFADY